MATVYLNETVHLRDNWNDIVTPAAGFSVSLDETVHLRDNVVRDIGGISEQTKYIDDEVHLRDSYTRQVHDGFNVNINETVHLRDSHTRDISVAGIIKFLTEEVHLREEITKVEVKTNIVFSYNENISFGETKEPGYKEYSHRFRWTNYNGVAVPDMNYKDLKEPIVRMMPAPSFLQFEYANSFLLFTRNSINRFVLTPDVDTGEWRARTDNLIEEFKDLGLMSPKTLILAKDTLFGLSEKGVWKWNKKGLDLISDKILALPDAGDYEYIAFYNSIRNQYILHRQESGGFYIQLSSGTPVAAPGSMNFGYVESVMIGDEKFAALGFYDADNLYVVVGEVDTLAQSINYGTEQHTGWGKQYAKIGILSMDNGNSVVWNADQSGGLRKVKAATISGLNLTLGAPIDVTYGNYDGGGMMKFSESRFGVFTSNTDYQTGTVVGNVVTLDTQQYGGLPAFDVFESVYMQNGISVIVYGAASGTLYARTVEDNGDGTIKFGTALNTGITLPGSNGDVDIKKASSTLIFLAASIGDDLKTLPLILTDTTITKGTEKTKTGYFDNASGFTALTIAVKGSSGFWLFFEDARNSSYLTAMWGAGSVVDMVMAESIVKEIQTDTAQAVDALAVVGGQAVLFYQEGNLYTDDGYSSVWGLEYANIDSWVYQIDRDRWGKFLGMDILDIPVILSGGSLDENYNLWLDSERQLMKYPGTAYTAVEAFIRTKEFYILKGVFQRYLIDFEGSSVDVETRVKRIVSGSETVTEDIKYNITPNEMRLIALAKSRGRSMSIKLYNADIISALLYDIKEWGER